VGVDPWMLFYQFNLDDMSEIPLVILVTLPSRGITSMREQRDIFKIFDRDRFGLMPKLEVVYFVGFDDCPRLFFGCQIIEEMRICYLF
jgi:hypothetical protein